MTRIPDVIDCWYDSGAGSFAQFHYPFENKKEFEKRFPYDFIAEGIDQTRGWFYTLHVLGTLLFGKPAYKNVICSGFILAEDGKKFSKRLGNFLPPIDVCNKFGADTLRMYLIGSPAAHGNSFKFEEEKIVEFEEKPEGNGGWINGGFFVLSPKAIDFIDDDSTHWEHALMRRLVAEGQLSAYYHHGFWHPMDTLRDKNVLEELWSSGKAPWKSWQ